MVTFGVYRRLREGWLGDVKRVGEERRTRVKICGITRVDDAHTAAKLGADAIGLVFYPPSPRAVDISQAQEITSALPPFVTVVALFVNPPPEDVEAVLRAVPVDLLQFHGSEAPQECLRFGRPYIKAVSMRDDVELTRSVREHSSARALLLDSYKAGILGGTGTRFDWSLIPEELGKPIILAGGLTADNVAGAIRRVNPYAVDVSGGVEAGKGIKDAYKLAAFIGEVNSVRGS